MQQDNIKGIIDSLHKDGNGNELFSWLLEGLPRGYEFDANHKTLFSELVQEGSFEVIEFLSGNDNISLPKMLIGNIYHKYSSHLKYPEGLTRLLKSIPRKFHPDTKELLNKESYNNLEHIYCLVRSKWTSISDSEIDSLVDSTKDLLIDNEYLQLEIARTAAALLDELDLDQELGSFYYLMDRISEETNSDLVLMYMPIITSKFSRDIEYSVPLDLLPRFKEELLRSYLSFNSFTNPTANMAKALLKLVDKGTLDRRVLLYYFNHESRGFLPDEELDRDIDKLMTSLDSELSRRKKIHSTKLSGIKGVADSNTRCVVGESYEPSFFLLELSGYGYLEYTEVPYGPNSSITSESARVLGERYGLIFVGDSYLEMDEVVSRDVISELVTIEALLDRPIYELIRDYINKRNLKRFEMLKRTLSDETLKSIKDLEKKARLKYVKEYLNTRLGETDLHRRGRY